MTTPSKEARARRTQVVRAKLIKADEAKPAKVRKVKLKPRVKASAEAGA